MPVLSGAKISAHLARGGSVWVLSDVHANDEAFTAALRLVPEDACLVILGDLLTYGCQPVEVMTRLAQLRSEREIALVLGNHDQLYIDLLSGDQSYYKGLPSWIRETVDWTMDRIDPKWWHEEFGWRQEVVAGVILFDHANPYAYGNWQYLNTLEEHSSALEALVGRGYDLGVFGHSHRPKCLLVGDDGEQFLEREIDLTMPGGDQAIVNVGSVGQPRGMSRHGTALEIKADSGGLRLRHHQVNYDLDAHLTKIRKSSLPEATRARLCSFYGASVL